MKKWMPLLVAALWVCVGSAVYAHPLPKSASPKPGAILAAGPTEIRIGFSEGLVAAFCGIEVDGQNGKAAGTGDATVDPQDDKELVVRIRAKLAPDTYTVKWHAVGADTHHTSGHYSFQVKM